jgi:uncharacterized protein Usg
LDQRKKREVLALTASPFPTPEYRLTTAEIIYRLPDHPDLLQMFIWQTFDLSPGLPKLQRFLKFWRENIEGELHSVRIGQGATPVRRAPHMLSTSDTRH